VFAVLKETIPLVGGSLTGIGESVSGCEPQCAAIA